MKNDKYIYDQFKDNLSFKKLLIEFLKNHTNTEFGGNKIYLGSKDHLTQNPYELTELIFFLKRYQLKNKLRGL